MIISRSPYRVSFAGGGTDLSSFCDYEPGAVLSIAINRYVFVSLKTIDRGISLHLAKEDKRHFPAAEVLDHGLLRHAVHRAARGRALEIGVRGDLQGGTGIGSSAAVTVAALKALHFLSGKKRLSPEALAREACEIELNDVQKAGGRQDQYATALGGINYLEFGPNGFVHATPLSPSKSVIETLNTHILLVSTGLRRDAAAIMKDQFDHATEKRNVRRMMRDLAARMRDSLMTDFTPSAFGELLHRGWQLKRSMGYSITNPAIDAMYSKGIQAGAMGGKVLGAGGGGFMMFFADPQNHMEIVKTLGNPYWLRVSMDSEGAKIVFSRQARAQ